jgi:hypothetical protein
MYLVPRTSYLTAEQIVWFSYITQYDYREGVIFPGQVALPDLSPSPICISVLLPLPLPIPPPTLPLPLPLLMA